MPDLETATHDELVDELARRHEAVVVLTIKPAKNSPSEQDFQVDYRGGYTLCVGMAARCTRQMLDQASTNQTHIPGDPEP